MSRTLDPQLSFADLELSRLGVHLDPILQGIDAFLEQHSALVEHVRRDLERGLKNPGTGRNRITPSQTLRSWTLMRVKNWDYRELRERINDGYTLRGFTQFDSHLVPQHDAFNRAFHRLTPATLEAINQAVVQAAVQLGLEDGPGTDHRLPGAGGEPRRQRPGGSFAGASSANLPAPSRVVRRRSRLLQRRKCTALPEG